MKRVAIVLLLSTTLLAAADVTGKWSGTLTFTRNDGTEGGGTALMILKQEGDKVTGSGGPNEGEQMPISNGKVEGDRLTCQINEINFELRVREDQLEGTIKMERDGQTRQGKLSLKRVVQ